jgi:hypothetical protein
VDRARLFAACASIALVAATLSPLLRKPTDDGFPLSTYPMFASRRPTKLTMHYALGEGAGGERRMLTPRVVGTGEVLQAMRVIDRSVSRGPHEIAKLCETVAAFVAADDEFSDVVAIRIVTGTHDSVDYLARGIVGRELQRTKCMVKR